MAWNKVANDTAAVLSAEAAGALDKCAYLPGRQSQRSGDRLSACVAFGWRGELMCSHRLAAVSTISTAPSVWCSSIPRVHGRGAEGGRHRTSGGGVANRRRPMAAAPRPDSVGPEPAIDGIAGGAGCGNAGGRCRSCGLRSADLVALRCVRLLCRQAIGGGWEPAGFEVLRGGTGR